MEGTLLCVLEVGHYFISRERKSKEVSSLYGDSTAHTESVTSVPPSSLQTALWVCGLPLVAHESAKVIM